MLAHPSAGQHGLAAEVNERVAEDQGATLPVSGLPHLFRLKAPSWALAEEGPFNRADKGGQIC